MRTLAMLTVAVTAASGFGQDKPAEFNPAPRFNVFFNERFFTQGSPTLALAAAVKAAELGQYDYITAYLLEESVANARIAARAKEFEKPAERDLRAMRSQEKADPFKPLGENPLSVQPDDFARRVAVEAQYRGFNKVVNDVRERFVEDPSHIRELQNYLRNGELTTQNDTAKLALKNDKAKAIYFKKVGSRWFLEDRITEPATATP